MIRSPVEVVQSRIRLLLGSALCGQLLACGELRGGEICHLHAGGNIACIRLAATTGHGEDHRKGNKKRDYPVHSRLLLGTCQDAYREAVKLKVRQNLDDLQSEITSQSANIRLREC
jgi:hypothetical protein